MSPGSEGDLLRAVELSGLRARDLDGERRRWGGAGGWDWLEIRRGVEGFLAIDGGNPFVRQGRVNFFQRRFELVVHGGGLVAEEMESCFIAVSREHQPPLLDEE